jgi:hypothetical protein
MSLHGRTELGGQVVLQVPREHVSDIRAAGQRLIRAGGELLPKIGPSAMKPALHRRHADPDDLSDLLGSQAFDVPEHKDLPVGGLEPLKPRLDLPPHFGGLSLLVRARRDGSDLLLFCEAQLLERRLVLRGEFALPPLLDAEASGDREEPGGQGRRSAEITKRAGQGQHGVLQDILGVFGMAAHLHTEAIQLGLHRPKEVFERRDISLAGALQQA